MDLRQWFNVLDEDKSGEISTNELVDPLLTVGLCRSRQQVERLVSKIDVDGSGAIGFDEFVNIVCSEEGEDPNSANALVQLYRAVARALSANREFAERVGKQNLALAMDDSAKLAALGAVLMGGVTWLKSYGGPLDYEEVVYYSYWALMYLWFKFLLIWRFFRLWAVCDDVEPVENMERCMNNNFTVGGFWRAWHRSFNRWLVRYIYVPLGGNSIGPLRKAFNILVVFTFVGFWHDLKPELFAWGWLLSLFFMPEIVAERVSRIESVRAWMEKHPLAGRWIVSFLGACNIIMLKIANIVGYTTGLEGAAMLLPALQSWDGLLFVSGYLFEMTIGVQCMLFIRDARETRSGVGATKRI
ncbi:Glycerol uptake protein 1 [Hondaea fermentalgiana]|uniref:Glycerol uptake protein 1 n=1 Tax=Hondaea fermentalgiana TaxID=2315210 RepID=A0A2R5GHW7_9STRA|nr:Glycerol uptake protein 1 [Hondaea fermentalgiana]|eukprot:GBG30487.1 Glycerol uptake protein 1 [Hondaea fermentalgiana]